MNRRRFIKLSSLSLFGLFLPRFQPPIYEFGGWFLMSPICPDDGPCDTRCLQYLSFIGNQSQRDAFFNATGEFEALKGRGWYIFSYPRQLTDEEMMSLGELFEERCRELRFPILSY